MVVRLRPLVIVLFFAAIGAFCVAWTGPVSAMEFEIAKLSYGGKCKGRCAQVMVATGVMDLGTTDQFLTFAEKAMSQGSNNVLLIDSPGGHLIEGLRLGYLLRSMNTSVYVARVVPAGDGYAALNGSCMSACVYALMGGSKRYVTLGSRLGIHRELLPGSMGNDPTSVLRSERRFPQITQMVRNYAQNMGVDPALVDLAEQYGAGGIRLLTPDDVKRFRLAKIAP